MRNRRGWLRLGCRLGSAGVLLLAGLLGPVGSARHAFAGDEQVALSVASGVEGPQAWGGPMRLGLPADRWRSEPEAIAPRPQRSGLCRRLRGAVAGLGETYAGFTLRATLRSQCALADAHAARPVWDWPWSTLETGAVAPARLHRAFGAWQIRCGTGPARRRCALVLAGPRPEGAVRDAGAGAGIGVHFVIDRVAGREMMLWRVVVPRGGAAPRVAASDAAQIDLGLAEPAPGITAAKPADEGAAKAGVRIELDGRRLSQRYTACGAAGCILEVGADRAGRAATELSGGAVLVLEVAAQGGQAVRLALPADGFGQALVELIRLRRAERTGGPTR